MLILRKVKYNLVFFGMLVMMGSCKKDLLDVDPNYQGEWHSEPIVTALGTEVEKYFIIEGNEGVYGEFCELAPLGSNCGSFFSGEARFNRSEKKLFIGPWKNQAVFKVDNAPHLNSEGNWECTLTETTYIRE